MTISRVMRSKQQAQKTYDRLSRWYDWIAGDSEAAFVRVGLNMLDIKPGEEVLEIGFGTGHGMVALAQQVGDRGKVCGIELSRGMLERTLARIKKMGLAERVKLGLGDATNLPYAAHQFDAIFMSFTLELFDTPEIPVVLDECKRVLKDTGRLGVVAMAKTGKPGLMLRVYEWAHEHFPAYVDCRPIFVGEVLEQNGFRMTHSIRKMMWGLPVEMVSASKGNA